MPFRGRIAALAFLLSAALSFSQEGNTGPKPSFPPSPEAVKKSRESVRDILKSDYARRGARDLEALGRRLLRLARDTKDDAARRTSLSWTGARGNGRAGRRFPSRRAA